MLLCLEQQLLLLQLARCCVRLRSELSTRHTFFRRDNPRRPAVCSDLLLELLLRELECPGRGIGLERDVASLRLVRPVVRQLCRLRPRLRLRAAIAAGTHPRAVATIAERVLLRNLVREFVQQLARICAERVQLERLPHVDLAAPGRKRSVWLRRVFGVWRHALLPCAAPLCIAGTLPGRNTLARSWGPQPAQL